MQIRSCCIASGRICKLLEHIRTITADIYCQQLDQVNEVLHQNCPTFLNKKVVILQHDHTRVHSEKQTQGKISSKEQEILPDPPYLPDLACTDFHLYQLEHFISGRTFRNKEVENNHSNFFQGKPRFILM